MGLRTILLHALPELVGADYTEADHDGGARAHMLTLGLHAYTTGLDALRAGGRQDLGAGRVRLRHGFLRQAGSIESVRVGAVFRFSTRVSAMSRSRSSWPATSRRRPASTRMSRGSSECASPRISAGRRKLP